MQGVFCVKVSLLWYNLHMAIDRFNPKTRPLDLEKVAGRLMTGTEDAKAILVEYEVSPLEMLNMWRGLSQPVTAGGATQEAMIKMHPAFGPVILALHQPAYKKD